MATQITPYLHLTEAIPGSNEPFSTAVVNANWDAIDAFASNSNTRVTALETWRTTITPNLTTGLSPSGTQSARDTYYGVPVSATDRVVLANKAPRWFNTDKGWEEQYFAKDGDTAAGNPNPKFTRATEGWYPSITSGRVPISNGFTVVNTGGSVTRDGGGVLVAAGCTSLSFNNLFTNDFEVYDFEMFLQAAAAMDLYWRVRVGGVDNTTASYNRQNLQASAASTVAGNGVTGGTFGVVGRVDTTLGSAIDFTVRDPTNVNRRTTAKGTSYDTGNVLGLTGSLYNTGITHDGITFLPSSGSFSGTIRVFGRNPF